MELPDSEAPKLGVCLPNSSLLPQANRLKDWVLNCIANAVPFRVHSEALFQMEWDGLDELVIEPAALSDQGERKLLGFQAAGGQVTKL